MKNFPFIFIPCILFFAACNNDLYSSKDEAKIQSQAQKNLAEIQAYMIEKGLDPNEVKLIDPSQAADPDVVIEIKKNIDLYVEQKKDMIEKLDRMVILRKKMEDAKTDEDYEKLKQEYPDLFITATKSDTTRKN